MGSYQPYVDKFKACWHLTSCLSPCAVATQGNGNQHLYPQADTASKVR